MAKIDSHDVAHPLIQGFPLENFIRHLANDPNNHPDIRELAKVIFTGGKNRDPANVSMGLWSLHDAMHEHKHPAANNFNLMSAGDKVGLDAHTAKALHEESELTRRMANAPVNDDHGAFEWGLTPEAHATAAAIHMSSPELNTIQHMGGYPRAARDVFNRVSQRVKQLAPSASESDIKDSIRRHAYRSNKIWRQRHWNEGDTSKIDERDLGDVQPMKGRDLTGSTKRLYLNEKATRYRRLLRRMARKIGPKRYEMVAGDFIDALRRIRSEQQKGIRHTVETIAAKIGAKPASTVDALADSPHYSVPGVAQAIYSNTAPEAIHSLAAWAGLTGNIPGMAVFHYRPNGPDLLHRFRMAGSGQELRAKLDKANITGRVLVPHRSGYDVLVPDKGGALNDTVKNFTKQQKTELQTSTGHFKVIGSSDQAKARSMFRDAVTKQEQGVA